ncbi:MAG: carboxypeptidase-like regulatory domain-containing protein [Thermoanaerobaculia bacterium]|nr:carboxypeptidase-like regulatory domain-containing protein [Thermoanaerobaculia bacterium]
MRRTTGDLVRKGVGALLLFAAPAVAVTGTLSVTATDPVDGTDIPNAVISLRPVGGGPSQPLPPDGLVEEGEYVLCVRAPGFEVVKVRVTVLPNETTRKRVDLPRQTAALPGQPGILLGGGVRSDSSDDAKQTGGFETVSVNEEVVDQTPPDLDEINRGFDVEIDIDAAVVWATVPLPPRGRPSCLLATLGLAPRNDRCGSAAPEPGNQGLPRWGQTEVADDLISGTSSRRFHPALNLALGEGDVEVVFQSLTDRSVRNTFTESGLLWGAGFTGVWTTGEQPTGWYAGFSVRHEEIEELDTTRNPALQAEGGTVTERNTLDYDSQSAEIFAGYDFGRVAPWFGVRGRARDVTLKGRIEADFSALAGVPFVQTIDFRNDLEEDSVEAAAGVDFRFPKTRLFGRVEASGDGDNSSFAASLSYAL